MMIPLFEVLETFVSAAFDYQISLATRRFRGSHPRIGRSSERVPFRHHGSRRRHGWGADLGRLRLPGGGKSFTVASC